MLGFSIFIWSKRSLRADYNHFTFIVISDLAVFISIIIVCVSYLHYISFLFYSSLYECMLSHFSHVQLCSIPRTVACQAPLSMGFSRQKYYPLLQGIFLTQAVNLPLVFPALAAGSLPLAPPGKPLLTLMFFQLGWFSFLYHFLIFPLGLIWKVQSIPINLGVTLNIFNINLLFSKLQV